jgi:hypothetical protein
VTSKRTEESADEGQLSTQKIRSTKRLTGLTSKNTK